MLRLDDGYWTDHPDQLDQLIGIVRRVDLAADGLADTDLRALVGDLLAGRDGTGGDGVANG